MILKAKLPVSLLLLASLTIFTACQKEVSNGTDDAATTAAAELSTASEDDATADITFNDVYEQVLDASADFGLTDIGIIQASTSDFDIVPIMQDSMGPRCATVTIVPRDRNAWPKTVTIDYGNGCIMRDGKLRKGKIITVYSGPMFEPGSIATTTFQNHWVDSVQVEGTHVAKNNSTSAARIFTRSVKDGKLTHLNGNYTMWSGTHTNTQVEGLGTPRFPLDDVFTITGGARGQYKRGTKVVEWSRAIAEPLFKNFTCRWISKGIVRITRNADASVLNYGDGTCDNKATLTINGITKEIRLR
jgi:hypothetical protein